MGWTKVCETARPGICMLKGNAKARMTRDRLGQGTTVCVHTSMDVEQVSDHKLMMGYWFVVQGRTPLVTLVCKRECANGE